MIRGAGGGRPGESLAGRGHEPAARGDMRGRTISMRIPELTDRMKHGPGQALREDYRRFDKAFKQRLNSALRQSF